MADDAIKVKGLTKSYGKQRGVVDLNFSVIQGEVFGYLGPNGAGKTTTIRVLLDFMRPSQGQTEIFGLDSHKNSVEIKRLVGYLPGDLSLYENLTGTEILKFLAKFRDGVDWKYVEKLRSRLKVDLHQKIKKMSHGNKQKIGLIQAFMHKPKLVILDEPTSGLDPLIQHEFYHLVSETKGMGTTFFISSHNLPEVEKICDRVGIIREGELAIVERVETLREKALRPLEVHFSKAPKLEEFSKIEGVQDVRVEGNLLRCTVVGTLDSFVKEIAKYEVVNIISQEPNLEELFLTYYVDKEKS
ncbi:MAG: ABC transporter ATP-binding protein [Candidatus Woykebacteria bacterium]